MNRLLLAGLALCAMSGCSNQVAYRAQARPLPGSAMEGPRGDPALRPELLREVDGVDYSLYAIPVYPGARVSDGSGVAAKFGKGGKDQVHLTLESTDIVASIADWYKSQIKASEAYLLTGELASIEGTTGTGYHVAISIARLDSKSMIAMTIDQNP